MNEAEFFQAHVVGIHMVLIAVLGGAFYQLGYLMGRQRRRTAVQAPIKTSSA